MFWFFLLPLTVAFGLFLGVALVISIMAVGTALAPIPKVPLRYNVRNLQVRWKTTVVTALAFTLVVALLTVMLGFVKGMKELTQSTGHPGNVIVMSDGATDELFSSLNPGSPYLLPYEVQEHIARDENGRFLASQEVYGIVNHKLANSRPGSRQRRFVHLRGLDDPEIAAKVHGIELQPGGRWWSDSSVQKILKVEEGKTVEKTAYELVLGDGMAAIFGQDMNQGPVGPGEILHIGPRIWIVVGVMKPNGSAFGSEIWAKDELVGKILGRENTYTSMVARIRDPESARRAAQLLKLHQGARFQAQTEEDYYSKLAGTSQQFLYAVMFVAVVMAVGGILGVMNTMFAAVSQRTADIGVLRLLGFSPWQILMSFQFESLIMALVGGTLGCALGSLSHGWTASSLLSGGASGSGKSVVLQLIVDWHTLGVGIVFSLIMGALGGLIPALSAMRRGPLESLR